MISLSITSFPMVSLPITSLPMINFFPIVLQHFDFHFVPLTIFLKPGYHFLVSLTIVLCHFHLPLESIITFLHLVLLHPLLLNYPFKIYLVEIIII